MQPSDDIRQARAVEELPPEADRLLGAWEDLRAGRPAPDRQDLDLRQLGSILPSLFIAEQMGPGRGLAWRLAGTAVCNLYRRELTGTGLLDDWPAFERGVIERFLHGVTHAHRQAAFRLRLRTDRGQSILADMLALPLIPRTGRTQVLGGLFPGVDPQLRFYGAITDMEVQSARFLKPSNLKAATNPPLQARRKFHVIAGGLGLN